MNSKAFQCLSCRLKQTAVRTTQSSRRYASRKSSYPNVKQSDMEALLAGRSPLKPAYPEVLKADQEAFDARAKQIDELAGHIRPYTEREKQLLATRYTREQMAAIEAGEQAINPRDMVQHGRIRGDAFRPQYLDDFSTLRPLVDAPRTPPTSPRKPRPRQEDGDGEAYEHPRDAKLNIPGGLQSQTAAEEDPHLKRLMQQTGMSEDQIRRIRVKNLVQHRVVNQTRMGKIQSLYYLTIAGNEDGMVGVGEGKSAEFEDARRQSTMNAIRNMRPIPRYEDRTIYGDVEAKVGATVVQMSSRPPGFGNRCQHLIFELTRAAGISDLAARTPRSRNKMNVVKAAFKALTSQRLPEDVAKSRGRKMVDVRSVYYGGQTK